MSVNVEMIERLCDVVPKHLRAAGYEAWTCVLHTRVGLDVCRALGLNAKPLPVKTLIYNAEYVRRMLELGRHPTEEEAQPWFEAGAWAMGAGVRGADRAPNGRVGYNGHLVLAVEGRWLVDLSLDQFTRPAKDIILRYGYFEAPAFVTGAADDYGVEVNGSMVAYLRHDDRTFLRAPDWIEPNVNDPWTVDAINELRAGSLLAR